MLDVRVSDLEMGGILLAMRIKGELVTEITGLLDAAEASLTTIQMPSESVQRYGPIVIPSYNGSRHMENMTTLLPMHGVSVDTDRITSAEIFSDHETLDLQQHRPSIRVLQITDSRVHADRCAGAENGSAAGHATNSGGRNSTHTLVQIIQPFATSWLRPTSYTHPEIPSHAERLYPR